MSGVNNWRVALDWPGFLGKDLPHVEYLYENDAGETESDFSREVALAVLLIAEVAFLNSHWFKNDWLKEQQDLTSININTNDIFAWGYADTEGITYKEIEEVYRYWVKDPSWGIAVWAMLRNKEMPQAPVEKHIRAGGIWDLDALRVEHGLRANHYDGVSGVFARRKYDLYIDWCTAIGREPPSYDGDWWEGWKEYIAANPGWNTAEFELAEKTAAEKWRLENGYGLR